MLYAFCESHGVAHRRCGKLVVATSAEPASRRSSATRAKAARQRRARPAVARRRRGARAGAGAALRRRRCSRPSTGIVDSHGLMLALQGDLERAGGALALQSPVLAHAAAARARTWCEVGGEAPMALAARIVVNAAGLWAPALAAAMHGLGAAHVPQALSRQGQLLLAGRPRAVLAPDLPGARSRPGLGVHLTLDLAGQARFGPDVQWLRRGSPDDDRLPRRPGARRRLLRRDPPLLARAAATARCSRPTAACGPSCRGPASRRRTSCCRARPSTACAGW